MVKRMARQLTAGVVAALCFGAASFAFTNKADNQVLAVFDYPPWAMDPVMSNGPLPAYGSATCPSLPDAAVSYSSCLKSYFGLTGNWFLTNLGLDSSGALPPSGRFIQLAFNREIPRCGPTVYEGVNYTHCEIYALDPQIPQKIFLDYGLDDNAIIHANSRTSPADNIPPTHYVKPAAKLSDKEESKVTETVQSILSKYLVDIVDTRPTTGSYDTIYIGGKLSDLPNSVRSSSSRFISDALLGLAAEVPTEEINPNDTAVVLSDQPDFKGHSDLLAQVIAHEIGHILGLGHVYDDDQLMYPVANRAATDILGLTDLADIVGSSVVRVPGQQQDSNAVLGCMVGFSATQMRDCSTVESQSAFADLSLQSLSSSFFNARLFYSRPGDESFDAGDMFIDLGDISLGDVFTVGLPIFGDEKFVLEASLTEGGPLEDFAVYYDKNASDGPILTLTDRPVTATPEPNSLALVMAGLAFLLLRAQKRYLRRRRIA